MRSHSEPDYLPNIPPDPSEELCELNMLVLAGNEYSPSVSSQTPWSQVCTVSKSSMHIYEVTTYGISCLLDIVGARFHCAICDSVDICSNCESAGLPGNLDSSDGGHNSSHILIKV